MAQKKIYDYKVEPVKNKVLSALKRRKLESTVTDLVAATGLPTYQVQETIKRVSSEYRGHMKVTESGEILYYFPYGLHSQVKGLGPTLRRGLRRFWSTAIKVLSFLFKIWIVVMLVGYFVLFVALLVLAFLASIAASFASSSGRDGGRGRDDAFGGGMGFFLATQVLQWFVDIWFYSSIARDMQGRARRQRRPLHRSVFSYVFGVGDPNAGWDATEKKAIIRYIQGNKGIVTLEEFMALTGRNAEDAQDLLNEYLLEFDGEPEVTAEGSLYYRFNELLRSRDLPKEPVTRSTPKKDLYVFSNNKPSTNKWISFFNVVNLLFSGYFLYYSYTPIVAAPHKGAGLSFLYQVTSVLASRFLGLDPATVIPIVLGFIPLAFSAFFFLIPLVRRSRERRKNEDIKKSNFLKRIFDRILQNPLLVDPRKIQPFGADETPERWEQYRDASVKRFAAAKEADVEQVEGAFVYRIAELDREQRDVASVRESVDLASFNIGKTIYDSGE